MTSPALIFVFSGKRKSGKDYVTDILRHRLGVDTCSIMRLSAPIKEQYAQEHKLDYNRLLEATEYKEKYRADMIQWGEDRRKEDPGFFSRIITSGPGSENPLWIISDARRQTDMSWFQDNYPGKVITVRVTADDSAREQRGWIFTEGIDDAESECGLDSGVLFDAVVLNNGHNEELESAIWGLEQLAKKSMEKDS